MFKAQTNSCYFLTDTGTVDTETSQSMVALNDGSVYVTGIQSHGSSQIEDAALLKFDKCGNVLWIKYFTYASGYFKFTHLHLGKYTLQVSGELLHAKQNI